MSKRIPDQDNVAFPAHPTTTRFTEHPLQQLLEEDAHYSPAENGILDIKKGRRWFETITKVAGAGLYSYQPTFECRSAPRVEAEGKCYVQFSSYDYLGLIGHPAIEEAAMEAIRRFGTGSGGVRLLTGTNVLHRRLEAELAAFTGQEASITFTSGYMANLAIITALIGREGKVFADARIHRSIIDALKLAGTDYFLFSHNDPASLEELLLKHKDTGRKFIITEGIFSMDGDICPLPEIVTLKNRFNAYLILDEAHSLGVLGPSGRGTASHFGIAPTEIDIITGSLSKTIPANGGFVASTKAMIVYLQHDSAQFIFSGALCPPAAAAAIQALRVMEDEPWRVRKLWENAPALKKVIHEAGFDVSASCSPVIPLIIGEDHDTYRFVQFLLKKGILVVPVVYPAVPQGRSRIRICATASHTKEMYVQLAQQLAEFKQGSHAC